MTSQRKQAEAIARLHHAGQTDKAGRPYTEHLETVANFFSDETLQTIAWLHDILEDTDLSAEDLRSFGFSEEIVGTVADLTRIPGEDYGEYIRCLSKNPLAVEVKLADLHHNMDLSRLPEVTPKDLKRLEKYRKAEHFLRQLNQKDPIIMNHKTENQNQKRKRIAIIATGGTIAGQGKPGEAASYQAGEIPVSSIIESIPQVEDLAELTLHTVCQMDSNDITVRELDEIRKLCKKFEANDQVDGIVITHGTDTFEESSFLLNMILDGKKPVVMTGAMRPATAVSADGPMNLYQAIALACDERVSEMGVLAVFNDTIYSGSDLKKTDGLKTDAFKYNEFGTIGFMRDGQAFLVHDPKMGRSLHGRFSDVDLMILPKVEIFYVHQESDPELLRYCLDHYDGLILAGTGSGNYPKAIESVIEADEGPCKIVRSSRLLHGIVFDSPVFDPSGRTIPSYRLSPHKSRILLALAMSQTRDDEELHDIFRLY